MTKVTMKKKGWVLRKLDKTKLRESLEFEKRQGRLQQIAQNQNAEALVEFTVNTIITACNKAMLRQSERASRRAPVYWWTLEIADLRRICLVARRKFQRGRGRQEELRLEKDYRRAKKKLKMAIKQSKEKCWMELCRSVDEDPWRLPYRLVIKRLIGGSQIPGLTCTKRVKEIVTALFPKHEKRLPLTLQDKEEAVAPFSIAELCKTQKRLKIGKAPGPDKIPNEIITEGIDI